MQKKVDKPEKVIIPLEDVDILVSFKDSSAFRVVKRVANIYIENLMKVAFNLTESDPNFTLRHTELTSQALGIRSLIRAIDKVGEMREKLDKEK